MRCNKYRALEDVKKLNIKKGDIFIQVLPDVSIIRQVDGFVNLELVDENNKFFEIVSDIEFKDSPYFEDACKMAENEKELQQEVIRVAKEKILFCDNVLALKDGVDEIEQLR